MSSQLTLGSKFVRIQPRKSSNPDFPLSASLALGLALWPGRVVERQRGKLASRLEKLGLHPAESAVVAGEPLDAG